MVYDRRYAAIPQLAASAASLLLLAAAASAQLVPQDSEYDCTIIASTEQFPEGISGNVTINASGRVAFDATVQRQPRIFEILTGAGDTNAMDDPVTAPVARAGPPGDAFFSAISSPVIDSQGRVQWLGY